MQLTGRWLLAAALTVATVSPSATLAAPVDTNGPAATRELSGIAARQRPPGGGPKSTDGTAVARELTGEIAARQFGSPPGSGPKSTDDTVVA
ncbi:hypothetical protein K4F52_003134 [Lecanicillium sp. MT-2017a]|nr:hypothetical protein K4F52_003134 [Lecanicillium sp. MT-2017a]